MTKIAIITGGSRGIGRDTALQLARKGLDIIITYKSSEEEASEVVSVISEIGSKARAFQLDLGKPIGTFDVFISNVSEYLKKTYGEAKFDYLINNGGIGGHTSVAEASEEEFDLMVNVHFKGVYFLTQKLLPFINNKGGIVNISSGLTRRTFPNTSTYATVKGAVEVFTRVLAAELNEKKIRVNTVAPGAIQTDFNGGVTRDDPKMNQAVSSITALGRPGLPEDVGGVIAFLCTDNAYWINGQRLEVSGGMAL
ncbi:SDR family oxidoreductase [Maribacter sp. PR1]|uniref:SDR family oxidoreductase n=1 Tax=Maribacter cobaltidurans TaxID=1178778 RepID=A0ABU7IYK6_9FLAO|nr:MULTISPECIES: SDR family oxidoreductase [Maribacter]MDC6390617.1 SDR family oxidoreductase [Maribacter sp. PR1]MEE1978008.1 SDR family oxidoreductase [Maribacter cobaltidurans]